MSSSAYVYDISNNLTQITNTAGTLGVSAWYHYDKINRPTKSYFNSAAEHRYEYDSLGRLESSDIKLSGNIINRDYTYYIAAVRNSGSSTTYKTTQIKTESIGDREYLYTYDNTGNIISISEKTASDSSYTEKVSYVYDTLGQLIRENNKYLNKSVTYTYDNGGNIQSVKEYAYTTGTLGTVTSTVNYTYDSAWKDKLTKYGSQSITYDETGNPLAYRDGMSFTWFGRQMQTANVNGTAISYKYNADGLRTEKKVGSTVHTYEYTGSTLFYENRGGMQLHYRYDVNGNLASITRIKADGTKFTLYAVCNSRGDVEELRTLAGDLYARYIYDSWGNTLHIYNASGAEITSTANLAVQNPIRYRGYYYDAETGLYYLQSRYYDPEICRFLSSDSIIDSAAGVLGNNIFTYCANNPVIFKDDSGYWVETAWDFFSFGKSLYDVCKNPDDPMAWLGLGLDGLSLLAPGIPALSGTLKVVSYADDVYDACNAVDTVIDTSKTVDNIVDTVKKVPNPYGKLGGPAHRSTINNILSQYPNATIDTEVRITIKNGYKPCRYADFSVTENGHTWYGNVGRQNKNGTPVAREQRALDDIRKMNLDIRFFPYN